MKNILFILLLILFTSCEEVIDVDLRTAEPKLVIDANINWEKGTIGNIQTIKISTTTGYFDNTIPKVSGATVFITNSSNTVFDFIEESGDNLNSGRYTCENFSPQLGETYKLTVTYKGETYTATEKLMPTPDITDIEQQNDLGLNNDQIGLKINFNDIPNQKNYYLMRFETSLNPFSEYEVLDDLFNEGNKMNSLYSHEDLESGSTVDFILYGVSESHHNYMRLLIAASASADGGPFQVTPTVVKGNIINQSNPNEYPFGYFRLGEIDSVNYIVN